MFSSLATVAPARSLHRRLYRHAWGSLSTSTQHYYLYLYSVEPQSSRRIASSSYKRSCPIYARSSGLSLHHQQPRRSSSAPPPMPAKTIDGTAIAKKIRESIKTDIQLKQKLSPAYKPSLVIVQDLATYVRMKLKAAKEANILCRLDQFTTETSQAELLSHIISLNRDASIHGILVQLPLPPHMEEHAITTAVSSQKDVDGFGVDSIGQLAKQGGRPLFTPCTAAGVMVLLKETGISIDGQHAVVLGRSDVVGAPVSYMLKNADATVTMCHSKTRKVPEFVKSADILVAAIGVPEFVQGEWLKPGAVVIDVGTNYVPDESRKSGQRLVGDVHFQSASSVASYITPVPGGVGPLTVAMLLRNVATSADAFFSREQVVQE